MSYFPEDIPHMTNEEMREHGINAKRERGMTEIDGYTTPNMPVKKNGEWLIISFKDGEYAKYKPDEYTDYYYDKICFVVIKDRRWIGIYNIDEIKYVEVVQE